MVDDKENIIKIEIMDNSINRLNLHELLQYSLRKLLEEQLKGKDCSRIQNRLDAINRAVAIEAYKQCLLENNKSFYCENPIPLQKTEQDDYAEHYFVKLNDLSGKWKNDSRETPKESREIPMGKSSHEN